MELSEIKTTLISIFLVMSPFLTAGRPFHFLTFAPALADIVMFIVFLLVIMEVCISPARSSLSALDIIVFIYFLIAFFGLWIGDIGSFSFRIKGFRGGYYYILAYFVGSFGRFKQTDFEKFMKIVFIVALVVAINGIRQFMFSLPQEVAYSFLHGAGGRFHGDLYFRPLSTFRIYSTMISSTHLAMFMMMASTSIVYLFVSNKIRKLTLVVASSLFVVVVMLSFSRTLIVSTLVLYGLIFLLLFIRHFFSVKDVVKISVVCISIIYFVVTINPILKQRILTLIEFQNISSFQSRSQILEERIQDISNHPILGYGTGVAGFQRTGQDERYLVCDNQYLKSAVENGLGALLLFLLIVFLVIKKITLLRKKRAPMVLFFLLFHVSLILPMMFGQVLEAFPINALYWLTLGFVEGEFKNGDYHCYSANA